MRRKIKLLSFLGTTKYIESYYEYSGRKTKNACRFIQQALLELFGEDIAEVVIFMTNESKHKNWLGKNQCSDANFEKGLEVILEDRKKELGLRMEIKPVIIPEGKNESELWQIFETIIENIEDEDNIVFDITHSYRSLPLLSVIVLSYTRFLKKSNLRKMLYGAMEALGSLQEVGKLEVEKRVVPIFDLTPFTSLFDWTVAIERFMSSGDSGKIKELGISSLKPLLAETKGKAGGNLRNLINGLDKFSKDVSTCRAPNFKEDVEKIVNQIPLAQKELEKLKPLKPLFEKIENTFKSMYSEDDVLLEIAVSRWCLEKGLIQQGYTILREAIINYVLETFGGDKEEEKQRKKIEDFLGNFLQNVKHALEEQKTKKIPEELLRLWVEMVEYRNDLNHAGWRKNRHNPDRFKNKLEGFINRFEKIVKRGLRHECKEF